MWDRLLWGVLFFGDLPEDKPLLIGDAWNADVFGKPLRYDGEPTRPLLFCTQKQARTWCKERMREWMKRDDFVAKWVVRPVRVRETVRVEIPLSSAEGMLNED